MTNKQYIYSGNGSPIDNSVMPDAVTAHYLDIDSRDIWLWDADDWRRIYVGGSAGMVAMYHNPIPLGSPPKGPSIVSYNGECYVSYSPTIGTFAWQKITVEPMP